MMPDYRTVVAGKTFWDAPEADIFPLPVVAAALGVGRNFMCKIPVSPVIYSGRKYYGKGGILDWALTDDGKALLQALRSKNTRIGKMEQMCSKALDYSLHFNGRDERGRKDLQKKRLYEELNDYAFRLRCAEWPETNETKMVRGLAVETYKNLQAMIRRKPSRISGWWLIENDDIREKCHKEMWEKKLQARNGTKIDTY